MRCWCLLLALAACGTGGGLAGAPTGPMPAGAVARVGGDVIVGESIGWAAALSHSSVDEAKERLVRDALFAAQARAASLDEDAAVRAGIQAALARGLLRELARTARGGGPPTDAEVARVTARHWLDLARPEGFRVVHTVVRLDAKADDATRRRAVAVADAVRRAVAPLGAEAAQTSPPPQPRPGERPVDDPIVDRFRARADAVPKEGLTVTTELLPAVAADGRVLAPDGGGFDPAFASAVARLGARGDTSEPITSSFGLHVAMLLERIPAAMPGLDERRKLVEEEVMMERARLAQSAVLLDARKLVTYDERADALLALVVVDGSATHADASPP